MAANSWSRTSAPLLEHMDLWEALIRIKGLAGSVGSLTVATLTLSKRKRTSFLISVNSGSGTLDQATAYQRKSGEKPEQKVIA